MTTTGLGLFSGGLDSILACRVLAQQGINVVALKFISPFFEYDLLANEDEYCASIKEKFGISVVLRDISLEYIELIKHPAHGYGKHFNPCLDCKIFMMSRARELMPEFNADFIFSGEVVGQRPMSQRRDALRVVQRDSKCEELLLRPLCAKCLEPTQMEKNGIVDRELLCDFSGRGRTPQIALAKKFGITDYPNPAGGCMLTDPVVGERIKRFYADHDQVRITDMRLLTIGRQFILPGGSWLALGRKESENSIIADLMIAGDIRFELVDRPGPTAVLRFLGDNEDIGIAAGLVARHGKKGADGKPAAGLVSFVGEDGKTETIEGHPLDDAITRKWLW